MLAIVFLVQQWSGMLLRETYETIDAKFFALDEMPERPAVYRETVHDLQE